MLSELNAEPVNEEDRVSESLSNYPKYALWSSPSLIHTSRHGDEYRADREVRCALAHEITAAHLTRAAYVYVSQAKDHLESQRRQYELAEQTRRWLAHRGVSSM